MQPPLHASTTPASRAQHSPDGRADFEIPAGPANQYRLAQLDDHRGLARSALHWKAPRTLALQARISQVRVPGTWGFGFWNDPFGASLGFSGGVRKLPALPNAAWFFFASAENYLSLRDDLPASGQLAATFRSRAFPWPLLALGALAFPLLVWRPAARRIRTVARRLVQQDAARLAIDPTQWHRYQIEWREMDVFFHLDGEQVLHTEISPSGPLGLVIWVDNQYAAFRPDGALRYGTLENGENIRLEIRKLVIK